MFYYLKGILAAKRENFAVIDVHGVGYRVYTSITSLSMLGAVGDEAIMYTYLYVREDTMDLYGFASNEEKTMFERLLSVTGIGPKAALSILSVLTPAKLAVAVITADTKTLTKAQGVGAKAAQRIVLELKDKLNDIDSITLEELGKYESISESSALSEAVEALTALGYSQADAQTAVVGLEAESTEDAVKQALKRLMK